jgi:aspartyl-tRNA(Asn)/glutamyl-tRNA(Gln) amidotransferase subunit A
VKDLFDTAGVRTTYGSAVFSDYVPAASAEAVLRLEAAGWIDVGKANLHEFAYGVTSQNRHYGVVPNPVAPGRTAGGSSGGSAAALAAGLADGALGSDTGGSIRIPAACCGVTGFKPTYGLVSAGGVFPLAPSFDHVGPMARDVVGCVDLMGALAPDLAVTRVDSLEDVSVGVLWADACAPLVRARVLEAAALFGRAESIAFPDADGTVAMFMREIADVHRELYAEADELYGENIRPKIERCLAIGDPEVAEAMHARDALRAEAERALGSRRLLLTPTLAFVAPSADVDEVAARASFVKFTYVFNALGWPALALPAGPAEDGLPASVQLVGRPGDDEYVLGAGLALEAALAR